MNKLKNKIEYELVGDYYLPKIELNLKGFKPYSQLGKYARLRLNYLKTNDKITYQLMLMNGNLYIHLQEVQDTATNRMNKLVNEFAKQENITENLKAANQMDWVSAMNNIKNRAEEIVLQEVIYENV